MKAELLTMPSVRTAALRTDTTLTPTEVAKALKIGVRTAEAMMRSGDIESFRPGKGKLLRTTPKELDRYIARSFNAHRKSPLVRNIENTIACYCELQNLGRLTKEMELDLDRLNMQLGLLSTEKAARPGPAEAAA